MTRSKGEYTRKPMPRCNPHKHPSLKDIPDWEAYLCIVIWVGAIIKACTAVFQASYEHLEDLNDYYLEKGWLPWTEQRKDISDFEWDFWTKWMMRIWKWFIGHIAISQFFRHTYVAYRKRVHILYSLFALYWILGLPIVFLLLGHFLVMYIVIFTKSVICVWIAMATFLLSLNINATLDMMRSLLPSPNDDQVYPLVLLILAIKNLHYTSFSLDAVNHINKSTDDNKSTLQKLHHYSFLDMLVYVTYFPLFFTGPFIRYDTFRQHFEKAASNDALPPSKAQLVQYAKELTRLFFWVFAAEVILHYFYMGSLQSNQHLLDTMPMWQLGGTAYCVGQFFMLKYIALFGLPCFMAKLDGLDPPGQPKCVATIYLYSEMWKTFDRGLYTFIKTYIYIPLGGSRKGFLRQLLASLLAFCFIFVWHGGEWYLFVWVVGDYIGEMLEGLGKFFFKQPAVVEVIDNKLTGRWKRRLYGVMCVPMYTLYMWAINVYLSGSPHKGNTYFYRIVVEGFPVSTLTLFVVFYGCVQTSVQLQKWKDAKLKKE